MRSEWVSDVNWKVQTIDNRILIMRDHNWSFGAWEIAKLENKIIKNSLLVHVDSHLDDATDGVMVEGLFEANTKEEIIEVTKGFDPFSEIASSHSGMRIDNFIWASITRGTVGKVIFVSRDKKDMEIIEEIQKSNFEESKLIVSKLPSGFIQKYQRYMRIEDFLRNMIGKNYLKKLQVGQQYLI